MTTNVREGDRVKVVSYGGATKDELYIGLEGVVSFTRRVRNNEVYIVLLDNDPSPSLQTMLGGLPCYDYELEVLSA